MRRDPSETGDATRRTHLANERTQLAWWRTGLTAVAVGVAVGRVVPALGGGDQPLYAIVGVGYVLYGIALTLAGTWRQVQVHDAVLDARFRRQDPAMIFGLTLAGVVLGLATVTLILLGA